MDLTISYLDEALVRPKGRKFMVLAIGEVVDRDLFTQEPSEVGDVSERCFYGSMVKQMYWYT